MKTTSTPPTATRKWWEGGPRWQEDRLDIITLMRLQSCLFERLIWVSIDRSRYLLAEEESVEKVKMTEEQEWHKASNHVLCANNCGFFGSPTTLNLCSKCYKDHRLEEQHMSNAKLVVEKSLTPSEVPQLPSSETSASTSTAVSLSVATDLESGVVPASLSPAAVIMLLDLTVDIGGTGKHSTLPKLAILDHEQLTEETNHCFKIGSMKMKEEIKTCEEKVKKLVKKRTKTTRGRTATKNRKLTPHSNTYDKNID
ncbi:hypothetical protein LXL04_005005 [Taraxacum kok-saghyz]